MKTIQFKTNINCGGCLSKVRPVLDQTEGICEWQVNLQDADRTLTVETEDLTAEDIAAQVARAGFQAELK